MSRTDWGYLLLAILIAAVAAWIWYLRHNSQGQRWKRDVRKRRRARSDAARREAE